MKQAAYLAQYAGLRTVLGASRLAPLPVKRRIVGRVFEGVVRAGGLGRRVDDNLAYIYPHLDAATRTRMIGEVSRSVASTLCSLWFPQEFAREVADVRPEGPGWDALVRARAAGRGAVILTGHFGQFETIRHVLRVAGMPAGGIYRPNNNPWYDGYWVERAEWNGAPVIPKGRPGHRALTRHLRDGGFILILVDQAVRRGVPLDFLGKPALTSTGAATIAARHGAELVTAWGPVTDGRCRAVFDDPLDPSDPEGALSEYNARLGSWIGQHTTQWHWFHDRWKGRKGRKHA
ncbi:lysophospholipid acyltransferase family protein [Jannaschia sp. Os4]|uniref:lysophospholipid acyltransferase family protein n=1 Tax=Jannaschia sp. Os4 TaxID=2807617 RepID=UPI00193965F3|nr:lysophospholipid acyltransferase family protein [Jannaschia sp. Os4]MBM2575323.1 lysophospholipid acyltransferase family protein [Jannaschia sp. Os4]